MTNALIPPYRRLAAALSAVVWAGGARWRRRMAATFRAVLDDLGPDGEPLIRIDTPRGPLTFHCANDLTVWRAQTLLTKEPETIAWIDGFCPGDVFWDVGANVGLYSLYAVLVGAGQALAFEPSAANHAALCRNIRLNGMEDRIAALALALSDERALGALSLGDAAEGGALSTFHPDGVGENGAAPIDPQGALAYGVDAFIQDFNPPFPNHLKIDVDGLEPRIVAGAERTLADPRLRSASVELDDDRPEERDAVIAAFERAGLTLTSRAHAAMFDGGAYASLHNHRFERPAPGPASLQAPAP